MKNRFVKTPDADSGGDNVLLFSFSEKNRVDAFWTKEYGKWHKEFSLRGTVNPVSYYFWVKVDSVK